jgi:hypothetical protein
MDYFMQEIQMNVLKPTDKDLDFNLPYFIEESKDGGATWEVFGRYDSIQECNRIYNDVLQALFSDRAYRVSVLPEYREYLKSKGLLEV